MKKLVSLALVLLIGSAHAQISPQQKEALKEIRDFARELCTSVGAVGKTSEWKASAEAKAQVAGVVKKVADLGFKAAAEIGEKKFEGVLQSDLASVLSRDSDCRYKVFEKLEAKLLSSASESTPELPGKPTGRLQIPFAERYSIGMAKSEIDNAGGSVKFQLSSDKPPVEYFVIQSSYAGFPVEVALFLANGRIAKARATFASESILNRWEPRWESEVSKVRETKSGVSEQTHNRQCQQYSDVIVSKLLTRYSPPVKGFSETSTDDRASVEAAFSSDRLTIEFANSKEKVADFVPAKGDARITYRWTETRRAYRADRSNPSNILIGTNIHRGLYCKLELSAT
jgi:hypothetical protein